MTKRAGKRKRRNGVQPQKPTNGQPVAKPSTLVEDHLPSSESTALELRAVREGWMLGDASMDVARSNLMKKLATLATKETDADKLCRIVRTLAMAEQREKMIAIASLRLEKAKQSDLPPPVEGKVIGPVEKPAYQVVQELIARKEVRKALDRRPETPENDP